MEKEIKRRWYKPGTEVNKTLNDGGATVVSMDPLGLIESKNIRGYFNGSWLEKNDETGKWDSYGGSCGYLEINEDALDYWEPPIIPKDINDYPSYRTLDVDKFIFLGCYNKCDLYFTGYKVIAVGFENGKSVIHTSGNKLEVVVGLEVVRELGLWEKGK